MSTFGLKTTAKERSSPEKQAKCAFGESSYRRYEPTPWPTSHSTSTAGASAAKPRWTPCSSSALVFFERSLGRAAARRSSPGSQHRPGLPPSPFLQLPHRQFQAIIGFISYVFLFGASSFSLSDSPPPPSTNTWMRWKLDIISRHWLRRNFLLAGINRNVITRPLKHSTSAEINTAELRGLKHWIVKVD